MKTVDEELSDHTISNLSMIQLIAVGPDNAIDSHKEIYNDSRDTPDTVPSRCKIMSNGAYSKTESHQLNLKMSFNPDSDLNYLKNATVRYMT